LEKEIENLKNELAMNKRQKEMIAQLKIDLIQSKERVLSLEQRLQSECNSKVATYVDQLDDLKKQFDEKVIINLRFTCIYMLNLIFIVSILLHS